MIGDQHEAATKNVGSRFVQSPSYGKLVVGGFGRRRSEGNASGEFAKNSPARADHPGSGQVERRQILVGKRCESGLAALDQPGG